MDLDSTEEKKSQVNFFFKIDAFAIIKKTSFSGHIIYQFEFG